MLLCVIPAGIKFGKTPYGTSLSIKSCSVIPTCNMLTPSERKKTAWLLQNDWSELFESRVCKLTSHFSQIFANITNCKKICGIDSVDSSKTLYIIKLSDLKSSVAVV